MEDSSMWATLKRFNSKGKAIPAARSSREGNSKWSVGRWSHKSGSYAAGSTWHPFRERGPKTYKAPQEREIQHLAIWHPGDINPSHKCTNIRLKLQSTSSSKKRDRREINNKKEKSQNKVHSVLPPFKFPRLDQAWSWKKPWNFDSHQKKTWNSDSHHNCLIPESKTKIPESGQTSMDSSRDRAGKAKRTHLKSNGEQE